MPEGGQENLLAALGFCHESTNGFGKRLIDRFVEATHVSNGVAIGCMLLPPKAQNTRSQCPVLQQELLDAQAQLRMLQPVVFGSIAVALRRGHATALGEAGCSASLGMQVPRNGL